MSDSHVEVVVAPKEKRFAVRKPECATYMEFKEWMKYARRSPPPEDTGFCTDCTPMFQALSKMRGTCSNPAIKFRIDKEENVWEAYKP